MTRMDFDQAEQTQRPEYGPLGFRLRGEDFQCSPVIPDWVGVELAAAREEDEEGFRSSAALRQFFHAAIHPQDQERFFTMLKRGWSPKVLAPEPEDPLPNEHAEAVVLDPGWEPIGTNELRFLVEWLAEQYSKRPTTPPSGSAGGRRTNGRSSGAGSSSGRASARAGGS